MCAGVCMRARTGTRFLPRAHIPTPRRETSAGFGKAGPVIKNFAVQAIFTSLPFFLSVIQSDIKYFLDVVEAHIS